MTQSRLDFGEAPKRHFRAWTLIDDFYSGAAAGDALRHLLTQVDWRSDSIRIYGRLVPIPRLHCWFAEHIGAYRWSGLTMSGTAFPVWLEEIRREVSEAAGVSFNSALANLYRDGQDSIAWHADDEPELGPQPVIASLSFGATRRFRLRQTGTHRKTYGLDLHHGSLLLMHAGCQENWEHCVPKTKRAVEPRVNLTFRLLSPSQP